MVHVDCFSTHFLTLLCEDASLHKTSRQANKFVYLHISSPECQLVESKREIQKRLSALSSQGKTALRSPVLHFALTHRHSTGKCSSGCLYGCGSFEPSLCGALRLQPDAQCASSVTSSPPAMGGVTHDTEPSVSYPSSPGVAGNSKSSIDSKKKKLDILYHFQISYLFGRHVSD